MERIPMTAEGHAALQSELKNLKSVERPSIIAAISEARAHGDLSENAEYHAAKEKQSFIEGRISELDDKLARADVIDVSKLTGGKIRFGATVSLIDVDSEELIFILRSKVQHEKALSSMHSFMEGFSRQSQLNTVDDEEDISEAEDILRESLSSISFER